MNDQSKTTTATDTEPSSGLMTVPLWLVVLMMCLLFCAGVTFDQHGGWFEPRVYGPYVSIADLERFQPPKGNDPTILGRKLFESNCALCHGADGLGKPGQAPPLAGSEWVLAPGVNRLVRIPSVGLAGIIEVKGQQYNLSAGMAAMGAAYSDDQLAAVLSYVRNAWGNKAPFVTPDQVTAVRADLKGRVRQYSPDELKTLPESH